MLVREHSKEVKKFEKQSDHDVSLNEWQREGENSGWKCPGLLSNLRKVQQSKEVIGAKPECKEFYVSQHGSALVSSHSVLTRHGLWEVWPWHQCGHGFQRKTVKSLVEDASCSGRYARHSLRVYSVGAHWIQGRLNQGRTFQSNLYLSWVMNLYKELVLWRRQGWNKLGRYWGMRNIVVLGNHRE